MAFRRFYLESSAFQEGGVCIRGDLFHHIREVCRFANGDRFEVLPGNGRAWLVEITGAGPREIVAKKISEREIPPLPKPWITLALSIPKLPKVDWIVEKSVELGVHRVQPFVSDYSFLRKTSEVSPARLQRWEKLVRAATQQSGRGELMQIAPVLNMNDLMKEFNRSPSTGGLFPYEGDARAKLSATLQDLKRKNLDHLWIFIGSEGGFSSEEVRLFEANGLNPVSLGEQILRVETACVASLSIIKYEFDESL